MISALLSVTPQWSSANPICAACPLCCTELPFFAEWKTRTHFFHSGVCNRLWIVWGRVNFFRDGKQDKRFCSLSRKMLIRKTKWKYFQAKRYDRKNPPYDNDCHWIHLKPYVRAAGAKLFLSLCFRMLRSFGVYAWSTPEEKITMHCIQMLKALEVLKDFCS